MNIDWYYSFLSVSKHLNYRKASEELFLSQPSVFQQIKNLEQNLGTTLFEKDRRLIKLTPDGKLFIPIAKDLIDSYEKGLREMKLKQGMFTSHINVGVSSYVATYLISKFLPLFFESFPDISIDVSILEEGSSKELINGDIDISIGRKELYSNKISTEKICEGKIKLIVPNLAENIDLLDEEDYFQKYRIFSNNHLSYWEPLKKGIYHLIPHAIFTNVDSVITTLKLIEAGQGISYLPTYILAGEQISNVKIIEPLQIESPISFTYLSTIKSNMQIKKFNNLFIQFIKEEQKLSK